MRKILPFLALFALAACQLDKAQPMTPDEFFSSLKGPKVPTVHDTLLEAAQTAEKQGNFAMAAQLYQQVVEKRPEDRDVMLALADTYRRGGDPARAIALYDAILHKDPNMLGAKEGKGLALMAQGDFDTPAALFDEVVKADATRWKTLNALGILFTTRNMQNEAQQYFQAALKQSPTNPSVMNNLGLSQALGRQHDDAIATLKQASTLTNAGSIERQRVDLNLALVYATAGKLDEANAIAEEHFTGPALSNNRGLYAHLAKDDQLAKTYLNMALTESKTFYAKAWNNLQSIASDGTGDKFELAPSAAEPEPEPKKPAAKPAAKKKAETKKTKAKVEPKPADDEISTIVGHTGEDEPVPSPIP